MIRTFLLFLAMNMLLSWGFSQPRPDHSEPLEKKGFYVVVGAFAFPENAEKYCGHHKKTGMDVKVGYVDQCRLYYVYTSFNDEARLSIEEAALLRSKPEFWDCWVYHVGSEKNSIASDAPNPGADAISIPMDSATVIDSTTSIGPATRILIEDKENNLESDTKSGPSAEQELPTTSEVFLSLYNSTNDKVVEGTVSVVNSEKSTLIDKIKGNTYTVLPDPRSPSGKLILLCDALGYRKVQHEIVFNSLLSDSTSLFVEDVGTALLIKFELIKYIKGDIRGLYSVYFYNDAVIMRSESKYELNQLKNMMAENPHYKIMLHGHTNGNYFGRFVLRSDNGDFFSIPKNARTQMGSAKKLSLMRADIIRQYLITEGIDGLRIQIKGWGGQRPLYDKNSVFAKKNMSVELEIMED